MSTHYILLFGGMSNCESLLARIVRNEVMPILSVKFCLLLCEPLTIQQYNMKVILVIGIHGK